MKQYGIRITLPPGDPMAAPHLLGEGWEGFRWYATEAARDEAMSEMRRQPVYYRKGDAPSQILSKVERDG